MSVDTLRETFHINRVSASDIDDFLSAQTYRHDITQAYATISAREHAQLQCLCDIKIKQGPTPVYADIGVACLKSKHVVDVICGEPRDELISPSWANEHKDDQVVPGDLVITRQGAGTIGRVSIFLETSPRNTNDSLFKVRPSKVDSAYVAAYFRTYTGQRLLEKGVYGSTGQLNLSCDHVKRLPVLLISPLAQKYIGDKLRQANRLRSWAKIGARIPAFIDAILVGEIPERVVSEIIEAATIGAGEGLRFLRQALAEGYLEGKFAATLVDAIGRNVMGSVDVDRENFHVSVVKADDIDDFLSAQTYRPPIISACSAVTAIKHCKLQNLCLESIRQGATPHFSDVGNKCIKSKQTRDIYIEEEGYETVDPSHEKNERIIRLQKNDVLVTRQGAGTVGRASIFLDSEETYITDSLFLVRVDPVKADPGFVAAYLRSYTGQRLIEKGVYGSTGQLNLSSAALRNLPVADFDICLQRVLGDQIRVSDKATKLAKRLTNAAKILVEDLIEGQITEAQLIAAEQALQNGNDTLDRKILGRLKTDGIDGEGAALFSDLDELYRLLALAEVE